MSETVRCQGWRRDGGAFTFGPVRWAQCREEAVVELEVRNYGQAKFKKLPACLTCWKEALKTDGMEVKKVRPL
jgi:hypothetical protein